MGFSVVENSFSLGYAPPERVAKSMGLSVSSNNILAEDIWSLGVTFYEILTGDFLLKGNQEEIRTTIIRERLEPTLPNRPEYHTLAAFIREMLSPDIEKRPTVDLVIKALEGKFIPPRISNS